MKAAPPDANTTPREDQRQEMVADTPDVARLNGEFQRVIDRRGPRYYERMQQNYDVRRCQWAGKTSDGRKHGTKANPAWPYEGASDVEVPLVDKYIREDVAMLMQVWKANRVLVRPTKPGTDAGWAGRVTDFMRWLVGEAMEELEGEVELLANYLLERGAAVMGVFWERTESVVIQQIQLEQLQQAAQFAMARVARGDTDPRVQFQAQLPVLIMDPTMDEATAAMLEPVIEADESVDLSPSEVQQLIKDLREKGVAEFPKTVVLQDQPKVCALSLNQDVFLPVEAGFDLRNSPSLWRVERLTETQLSERVRTAGWDEAWVDEVIRTQRGVTSFDTVARGGRPMPGVGLGIGSGAPFESENLFEIIHAYERRYDKRGVPGIYYTCYSKGVDTRVGYYGLLNYASSTYPYVLVLLERTARSADDSRGRGETLRSVQRILKGDADGQLNRSAIATMPPSFCPPGESPQSWGPGSVIETRRPESFGFLAAPRFDQGSVVVGETWRRFGDELVGRPVDEQNKEQATLLRQDLARIWMKGLREVYSQILKLAQQFTTDEIYYRVTGSNDPRLLRTTREQIAGEFSLSVSFNVSDFDREYVETKLKLIQQVLALDKQGRVDSNELIELMFELVAPELGQRLLKPAENASQSEIEDEKDAAAKILLGIPMDVQPGQAHMLRLQTLQQLTQSPTVRGILEANPQARKMYETRAKQHQFQLQQSKNAATGRLGTEPMAQEAYGGQMHSAAPRDVEAPRAAA